MVLSFSRASSNVRLLLPKPARSKYTSLIIFCLAHIKTRENDDLIIKINHHSDIGIMILQFFMSYLAELCFDFIGFLAFKISDNSSSLISSGFNLILLAFSYSLDLLFLEVSLCRFPFPLHICLVTVTLMIMQPVIYSELFCNFIHCHILGLLAHITILYIFFFICIFF